MRHRAPTQTEIAKHLDLSVRRIRGLLDLGVIAENSTMDETRIAYIRYLRDCVNGSRQGEGDLSALYDLQLD